MIHNQYNLSKHKYHYFYKITNNITGQYYYGIHSTNNLNDGYMGSGSAIYRDIRRLGKEHFTKTIIRMFNSRDEASTYENEIVTKEVINDINCYNLRTGGDYGICVDTILCFDIRNGEMLRCKKDDPLYLNGTYVGFMTNRVAVFDTVDNMRKVISCDEYYKHKDRYQTSFKGKICVRDKNGKIFRVSKNDERYLSGELLPFWTGRKHSDMSKQKISNCKKGQGLNENNSQYGTCWVTRNKENLKIKLSQLDSYINDGWTRGRYNPHGVYKLVDIDPLVIYREKTNGLSWVQLEQKYRCSKETIRRYLKHNGLI